MPASPPSRGQPPVWCSVRAGSWPHAALLGVATALRLVPRCGGWPAECGTHFVEHAEGFVRASGTPLRSADGGAAGRSQLEVYHEACEALGGCFVKAQVDIFGYVSRLAAAASAAGSARNPVQSLHDFYTTHLTPQDLVDLETGIVLCVPAICQEHQDKLLQLAGMYFFSVAGVSFDLDLDTFTVGTEINMTLAGPQLCKGSLGGRSTGPRQRAKRRPWKATRTLLPATRCVKDARASSFDGSTPFGMPCIPRLICEERLVPPELVRSMAQCGPQGGHLMLMRFDLQAFRGRAHSEEAAGWDRAMTKSMSKLWEFYSARTDMVEEFSYGFGLCMPVSCLGDGQHGVPRAVLEMLVGLAQVVDSDLAWLSSDLLPDPRWNLDMNVSDWSASILESSKSQACVPTHELSANNDSPGIALYREESQEVPPDRPQVAEDPELGSEEAGGPASLLNGTGFHEPWWYGCDGPGMDPGWGVLARLLRIAFVRGDTEPLNKTLVEVADRLVSSHWKFGEDWVTRISKFPSQSCDLDYVHVQDLTGGLQFSPALYMLSGGERRSDARWWQIASWWHSTVRPQTND